jgi:hypothetical protein
LEGEAGADASRKLSELNIAYEDAIKFKKNSATYEDGSPFADVKALLKEGKVAEAQDRLDDYIDRSAEWHFIQAKIFYEKSWFSECKKQLEISVSMEPDNQKYKDTLARLKKDMSGNFAFNQHQSQSRPSAGYAPAGRSYRDSVNCCNVCNALICADCCCECMGGDCIPCC